MTRFLIFALERSGSSSLASALTQGYSVVQEPFSSLTGDLSSNPEFVRLLTSAQMLPEQLPDPPRGPFDFNRFHAIAHDRDRCGDYLTRLYSTFRGIKHVWNTVTPEGNFHILDWCLEHQVKIVRLSRRSLPRALISRHLAQQARVFDLGPALEHRERWKAAAFEPVDLEAFQGELEAITRDDERYRAHLQGNPHFELFYEQLFSGLFRRRRRVFAQTCQFLSMDHTDLDHETVERYLFTRQRKQTQRQQLKRIPNYRQLKPLL